MKTLIFNGSPRKNGETAYMIRTLQENLGGDFKVVNAYGADIRPCIDCRPISVQDISVKKNLFLRRKQEQFC